MLRPQSLRHHVDLPRSGPRGGWLANQHLAEGAAQVLQIGIRACALEDLHDEVALPLERLACKIEGELGQVHGRGLIGGIDSRDVGSDVAENEVGLVASEKARDVVEYGLVG